MWGILIAIYIPKLIWELEIHLHPKQSNMCKFLLTCGGIESVAWHPKILGRRSLGPNNTGAH